MGPLIDASTTSPRIQEDINITLKCLRHSHLNNVIFSYININSIRNNNNQQKRHQMNLFPIISSYINIISSYKLYIIDNKGSLMVFVKLHIPPRRLNVFKILSNILIITFEKILRKKMVSCINLQCSIPEKQIFSLICDKSIRIILNLL